MAGQPWGSLGPPAAAGESGLPAHSGVVLHMERNGLQSASSHSHGCGCLAGDGQLWVIRHPGNTTSSPRPLPISLVRADTGETPHRGLLLWNNSQVKVSNHFSSGGLKTAHQRGIARKCRRQPTEGGQRGEAGGLESRKASCTAVCFPGWPDHSRDTPTTTTTIVYVFAQ